MASAGDVDGIVDTVRAVYDEFGFTWDAEEYHADLYHVEGHYLAKGHPFFVATVDGRVVGTAALDIYPALPGSVGETAEIDGRVRACGTDCSMERLYVHPSFRRIGAGRALAQRLVEAGQERGCSAMELWSDKRFVQAHQLYLSMGARIIGERICHDPDKSPEWGLLLPV